MSIIDPGRRSLRRTITGFVFALVAVLGIAFAWTAYRDLQDALRASALARMDAAANQVADLLRDSARNRVAETGRLAQDPDLRALFTDASAAPPAAVAAFLTRNPLNAVLLYDSTGRFLRNAGGAPDAPASGNAPRPATAPAAGASALAIANQKVWYFTTAPVAGDPDHPGGFVTVRRPLASSQSATMIERLIGSGTILRFGNEDGDVWTDLSGAALKPSIRPQGAALYTLASGERWLGSAVPVPGTPWFVWAAVAEDIALAPAAALLSQMLPVILVLTIVGGLVVYLVSGRISRPLEKLTAAAESIAAGDYSRRVELSGRDEVGRLGIAFNAMADRVASHHESLEQRVRERTLALEEANRELEAFSYSVSHDLRAPLRHIAGFSALLQKHAAAALDQQGRRYLDTIDESARQMGRLVDDLLGFSRMARADMVRRDVDLGELVRDTVDEITREMPERRISWRIGSLPVVTGDRALLRLAVDNLVRNAVKYSSKRDVSEIEIGTEPRPGGEHVVYVKDNGAGFDMAYAGKLFGVFQRLHGDDFEGTGIGLANVRRVIHRHGGRTWAEGKIDGGATFYFSLPVTEEQAALT